MAEYYVDATQPLQWGPLPPVGIPRVENAFVRQAMRQSQVPVKMFVVERDGRSRLLNAVEQGYVSNMMESRIPLIEGHADKSYWHRLKTTLETIRGGAFLSGKEFDRSAAAYVSQRGRSGFLFSFSKTLIRLFKLTFEGKRRQDRPTEDPLADPAAHCFLSKVGMHRIAANRSTGPVRASLTTLLHDTIPIDRPDYFERQHAEKFKRDLDWMFDHCRQVVCVSERTARRARVYVAAERPDSASSIVVNPLGSFLREGVAGQREEAVDRLVGQSYAIYCSTIEIRKNHIVLLRAWKELMPKLGDRLPMLVLCGRWGWMVDEVKAFLAQNPEIEAKVLILSGISDPQLAWLYRNARFGLFPSHTEGWGLGAAECLDFDLPVLISDAEALSEATQGLMPVIPADDLDAWCAAIETASMDDAWLALLRAKIAAGYRPTPESEFAARLLDLMQASAAELPAPEAPPVLPDADLRLRAG